MTRGYAEGLRLYAEGLLLYTGGVWLYAGGPRLCDAMISVATMVCLQCSRAAHTVASIKMHMGPKI